MSLSRFSRSSTMPGTSSTNWFVWSTKGGISSATTTASTAKAPSNASSAPLARGTPRRSSRVAAAASGIAMMTVVSTARNSVTSWQNRKPNRNSAAASSTAR
jgi:hypothetical protein